MSILIQYNEPVDDTKLIDLVLDRLLQSPTKKTELILVIVRYGSARDLDLILHEFMFGGKTEDEDEQEAPIVVSIQKKLRKPGRTPTYYFIPQESQTKYAKDNIPGWREEAHTLAEALYKES